MPQDIPPCPTQRTARKRWLRQWGQLAADTAVPEDSEPSPIVIDVPSVSASAAASASEAPAPKKAKKKASKKKKA